MSESVFADRIVQNLLDTDFYKLTMMQAVLHNYPNVEVEWEFRCRNSEDLRPYLAEIRYQIERLAELSLSPDQLGFLERISFMKPDFLRFLGLFRFNLRYVQTGIENGELFIRLRGPWLHVILFEVPMLAIVSEVRNRYRYQTEHSYHGPRVDTFYMCIRAAQVGCGVALLPRFLVEEELADGKLVIPWQHAMPSQDAYYLAYPEHSAEVPKVRDFVKWMMEQVV